MEPEQQRTQAQTLARVSHAPDVWRRWGWVWQAIFYGLLALATTLVLADSAAPQKPLTLGLTAALGGWYWLVVGRSNACYGNIRRTLLYFAGVLPLWYLLAGLHPAFYLVLFSFYSQAYSLLPPIWSIGATLVLTAVSFWPTFADDPGTSDWTALITVLISTVIGAIVAIWINAIIRQSGERRSLIEALEQSQRELRSAERQAGVLAERQRLAGEIHDTLAQGFTSIVMHLEAADAALEPAASVARRHLDQARATARASLAEARSVIWELRPELQAQAALPEALANLAAHWAAESGIHAHATTTGTPHPLRPDVEVTLLRAAREALANVRKHAHATEVVVTLSYMDDLAVLDIQDNGVGVDANRVQASAAGAGGFGLPAKRVRVARVGGTLTLESVPGEGTTLVVEVPLAAPTPAEPADALLEVH